MAHSTAESLNKMCGITLYLIQVEVYRQIQGLPSYRWRPAFDACEIGFLRYGYNVEVASDNDIDPQSTAGGKNEQMSKPPPCVQNASCS
jgi:hypothetical protein